MDFEVCHFEVIHNLGDSKSRLDSVKDWSTQKMEENVKIEYGNIEYGTSNTETPKKTAGKP
jgi:hypothetical protein